jgi:hypothetical protein
MTMVPTSLPAHNSTCRTWADHANRYVWGMKSTATEQALEIPWSMSGTEGMTSEVPTSGAAFQCTTIRGQG